MKVPIELNEICTFPKFLYFTPFELWTNEQSGAAALDAAAKLPALKAQDFTASAERYKIYTPVQSIVFTTDP